MIRLLDTSLRDGQQRQGVHLTLEDKLRIIARLDALGVPYIEAGFPGSNPVDAALFEHYASGKLTLKHSHLVAFGITRRKQLDVCADEQLRALANCASSVVTLVGKAWLRQVSSVLQTTAEENLAMVAQSVAFLLAAGKEVLFDAEHYFDGYREDADFALAVLRAAASAGAKTLVLCDTNGGLLPHQAYQITEQTRAALDAAGIDAALGIHAHNDSGCAIANTLEAVRAGAEMAQGTVNGYGERVGNADLLGIIANLQLKMDCPVIAEAQLASLTALSQYVAEVFNIAADAHQPYVGARAFAHKGGLHGSGLAKMAGAYEHIAPKRVGNCAHLVVSDLAGKASLASKAEELGIALQLPDSDLDNFLAQLKSREASGYSYEMADASLALLLLSQAGQPKQLFRLESFRVIAEKRADGAVLTEATIKIFVDGQRHIATAEGNGPVNALDQALRMAIRRFYPQIDSLRLSDYRVRVLDESIGTSAVTRVGIETTDGCRSWGTVGVSENIIEASWDALVDSLTFGLLK